MSEKQSLKFSWQKITTDEFALIEQFELNHQVNIAIGIGFAAFPKEHTLGVQVKCTFNQLERPRLVVAVSGYFNIDPTDWESLEDGEKKVILPLLPAQSLASLVLSTLRGVLHSKTEGMAENSFILPPVSIPEIVKEPITIIFPS